MIDARGARDDASQDSLSRHHTSQSAAPTTSSQMEAVEVGIAEVHNRRSMTVVESNGLESDDGVLPM